MKYQKHDKEMTDKLYRLVEEKNEPRVFEMWHASSLAKCPREQYFLRKGVAPISTPGAGKMFRWDTGHKTEDNLMEYLDEMHPELKRNERMTNEELQLTGEYDGYDPETKTIHEVKSVHPYAMPYRKKDDTRYHVKGEKPYLNHRLQNHAYALLMNEEPEKITYHYLALDGRYARYTEDVKDKLIKEVKERLQILNTAWENNEAPDCLCSDEEHPLYKTTMQYCSYNDPKGECCNMHLLRMKENENAE